MHLGIHSSTQSILTINGQVSIVDMAPKVNGILKMRDLKSLRPEEMGKFRKVVYAFAS
jgi:hypothetical protein